ncbi:hypothetical protein H8711_11725 [Clostridiaceae bacterium NSJ-31]|uniref:Uncharacterized protein n=1 Tax=Ligaoa zhengdingensis TaxID=2763658 RepID=A0A926I5J9_9FIRM|nr:hypothetical protein [Ligaoa zhengdingensis]MBC8547593.1 hypothetical protein [Ligaoa zhengdingensis]
MPKKTLAKARGAAPEADNIIKQAAGTHASGLVFVVYSRAAAKSCTTGKPC